MVQSLKPMMEKCPELSAPVFSVYHTYAIQGIRNFKRRKGTKTAFNQSLRGEAAPPPHTHSLRYVNCGFSCIHTYWVNFPQTWGAQLISPASSTWVEPLKCADIYAGAYGAPLKNFDLPLPGGGTHIGKGYGDVPRSWPPFFRPVAAP